MTTVERAVVITTGGNAVNPFTTPWQACGSGLAAGSTATALREAILEAGYAVFTAPANAGPGAVTSAPGFGGFDDAPEQPAAELTVDSFAPHDEQSAHLLAFLDFLTATHGVREFDFVGHSMGAMLAVGAIRRTQQAGSPLRVRSLAALGTAWEGTFPADNALGHFDATLAAGHDRTMAVLRRWDRLEPGMDPEPVAQVGRRFLTEPGGWNERQAGVLADIPLRLAAGDHFHLEGGDPQLWPHDGLVALSSALGANVSDDVLPNRQILVRDGVHSIDIARAFGIAQEQALTWDPVILEWVIEGLDAA